MTEKKIRPYDVLIAMKRVEASWPDVIVPRTGRRFSAAAAHSVLVALHSHYNWTTFNIALPTGWGHRARPARGIDIAREVHLHPRTVGVIFRWLTDEQHILETIRGHGWTGATVRRFNLHRLGVVVEPEPDAMSGFHSAEAKPDLAEPEPDLESLFRPQNQGYESGDTETPGVVTHQGTTLTSGAAEVAPAQHLEEAVDEMPRDVVEQVIQRLSPSLREKASVLKPGPDCRVSREGNLLIIDFPRYESWYLRVERILAELVEAFGMDVELRLRGQRQEQQR